MIYPSLSPLTDVSSLVAPTSGRWLSTTQDDKLGMMRIGSVSCSVLAAQVLQREGLGYPE